LFVGNPPIGWFSHGDGLAADLAKDSVNTGGSIEYYMGDAVKDSVNGEARKGPETKPASISVYICIKY
jgi:hypothetical protein